jgi:hypothetical protein
MEKNIPWSCEKDTNKLGGLLMTKSDVSIFHSFHSFIHSIHSFILFILYIIIVCVERVAPRGLERANLTLIREAL